jgi:hypothetical protein
MPFYFSANAPRSGVPTTKSAAEVRGRLDIDLLGHLLFIRSEKAFTVEMDQMRRGLGDPNFGLPGNVIQVF